jgi:tetratricopeptide (TPR) repeat protein
MDAAWVDEISALVRDGNVDQARARVAEAGRASPLADATGQTLIATLTGDGEQALRQATRAAELGPDDPTALRVAAVAFLHAGEPAQAERCARRAANRDSGTDGLYTLGKVELAAGRLGDAESTLLKVLDHDPAHVRAMEALADGRWARGDRAAAVGWLAHAYEAAPEAPEALEKLVDLYKEAGWAVGAILLSRLTRQGHHSDDVKVALDLVALLLSARLEPAFPALGVVPAVDEIVEGLLAAAASRRPAVQLHVARVLFDLGRHADCATVAARLDAQPMTAPERAEWHYLAGMVDDEAGRSAEALEHYEAALAADGSRWDACCNALHLLLNAPDRDQRRRIPGLLAAVPRALAWERPQLLANAALYLAGEGRLAEAREHLERVRELVDDQGPLADLVRERLADLGAS